MGNIVIGIDGGGTTTRVMMASLDGTVIAYAETGCCNPNKDVQAKQHVRDALQEAAARSGRAPNCRSVRRPGRSRIGARYGMGRGIHRRIRRCNRFNRVTASQ
ncbi:hypothetical protein [Paenibacillus thiaminolyticus]|uniref:hypothetical protein n=1 Tax=Paenibacillus thiaminolyticus TaxID=49283 RepID=UPI002175FD16|nr:hypothetical protein [Paenibacillus thiaminolyticus]